MTSLLLPSGQGPDSFPHWPRLALAGFITLAFAFPPLALFWCRADPTANSYQISDLLPDVNYTIRARRDFADAHSCWTEVIAPPIVPAPAPVPELTK